ncbi:MAG TPA: hypothetical protein DCL48_13280 [Alphaproteobacteria bacterium]|nr:hypothetical protein [Alphaproteobacteria bacterium]
MLIGTLALTGFPGLSGYFSKDAIIESAYAAQSQVGTYAFVLSVAAAAMTSFYSWRLAFMTFHGPRRGDPHVLDEAHESPWVMVGPLVLLAIGAVAAGVVFAEYFIGHHRADFWRGAIFVSDAHKALLDEIHEVPKWVKYAPLVAMVIGLGFAYYFYIVNPALSARMAARQGPLYQFLYNKWYFDELYDAIFVRPAKWLGRLFWKGGDGWLIDGFGPNGIAARVLDTTAQAVRLQSGYVYWYAFVMLIGVTVAISYLLTVSPGAP